MNLKLVIFLFLGVGSFVVADHPQWVFFESDPQAPSLQLSLKAERRIDSRGSGDPQGNLMVSATYLTALRDAGFKIRHSSRFLNAASVEIENSEDLESLKRLSFVKSTQPVAWRQNRILPDRRVEPLLSKISDQNYGQSYTQNQLLNIPEIHNKGYDGSGIIVAVFDTGFDTQHPVFDHLNIIAHYDFVDHESDPAGAGHEHGINTLSILGGYSSGEVIGPAYGASYLLARTEDLTSESRAEEDNWVAALEWADSLGVDIISSSLNYRDFDNTADNYPFSALDGETAIISLAANIAAERGILVVNSAGNEGPSASSIWPPADSRHVLAVGATDSQGIIVSFSGRGPTYDGRTKPNLVAMGRSAYMASGTSAFKMASGTSFSTPQIAGLAALLLQSQPDLLPDSVISIFQEHGSLGHFPNNNYGYGIPDLSGLFTDLKSRSTRNCLFYPNPTTHSEVKMVLRDPVAANISSCRLFDVRGREIATITPSSESGNILRLVFPDDLVSQLIIVSVEAEGKRYSGKFVYLRT